MVAQAAAGPHAPHQMETSLADAHQRNIILHHTT